MFGKNKGLEMLSNLLLAGALLAAFLFGQYSWYLYVIILLLVAAIVLSVLIYQQQPGKTEKRKYLVRKSIILAIGAIVMIVAGFV